MVEEVLQGYPGGLTTDEVTSHLVEAQKAFYRDPKVTTYDALFKAARQGRALRDGNKWFPPVR